MHLGSDVAKKMYVIAAGRGDSIVPAALIADPGQLGFDQLALRLCEPPRRGVHSAASSLLSRGIGWQKRRAALIVSLIDCWPPTAVQPCAVSTKSNMPRSAIGRERLPHGKSFPFILIFLSFVQRAGSSPSPAVVEDDTARYSHLIVTMGLPKRLA